MSNSLRIQDCHRYLGAHLQSPKDHHGAATAPHALPAVTISRQTGARGRTIAAKLHQALNEKEGASGKPWAIFDKDLVHKILEDHSLPKELAKFMPDDAVGELESTINEILGRHPSQWTLFEYSVDTIARLCRIGHCILIGRGANQIARHFPNVLHLRFIGSEERRIRQIIARENRTMQDATSYIHEEDNARRRFMKKHFRANIGDPAQYDYVLNTDRFDDDTIVESLLPAILAKRAG